jgi:hypothetical protein
VVGRIEQGGEAVLAPTQLSPPVLTLAARACRFVRSVSGIDPVLLDDTDQQNDADQRGERLQPSAGCDGANPIGSILAPDELTNLFRGQIAHCFRARGSVEQRPPIGNRILPR